MDYAAHLRETAQHLVRMGSMPMAIEQARLRESELIASDPIYAVLPDMVREERARLRGLTKETP